MGRKDALVLISQPGQQFKTRIPDDLHSRIKEAAKANNRSANAEIVSRLEASFDAPKALASEVAFVIDQFIEQEVANRLRAIAASIGGSNAS